MTLPPMSATWARLLQSTAILLCLVAVPIVVAMTLIDLWHFDLSLPIIYNDHDGIWQFILTKVLFDTGWILNVPSLGAPDIAHWHGNAAAQTSALHSILMRGIAPFVSDAITLQQVYFLLNFPLIAATSFLSARLIGVGRWPACCVALLFAFGTFRLSMFLYAYLANYAVVPLSVVPPIWILTGRLDGPWRAVLRSRAFWASLVITVLAALTDGYYAFFTLLFIGFTGGLRFLTQWRVGSLVAPVVLATALIATAYSLAWPLRNYRHDHPTEFLVDGKADPMMITQPFEAEVYSSSLKLMLAPIPDHRIPQVAQFGAWLVETSDRARAFPSGGRMQLGTLASACLIGALLLTMIRAAYARTWSLSSQASRHAPELGAILALILFSFLCATAGGIGSLVALVYPMIRAYERLTLFIAIFLYLGAGLLFTRFLTAATRRTRAIAAVSAIVLIPLAILDQAPRDLAKRDPAQLARFVAERNFIQKIEASAPDRMEIYQYPYSNYLINSSYYGWGSFSHIRFYLYSHHLRWSNGAFKNSPVDNWDMRMAALPLDQLITQMRAAGFGGLLVDRTVVGDAEYDRVRDRLIAQTGVDPVLDPASRLAFWRLPPLGYRVVYDPEYRQAIEVAVDDAKIISPREIARSLDPKGFLQTVALHTTGTPFVIERSAHPEAFADIRLADAALGLVSLAPPFRALQADVLCPATPDSLSGDDVLQLTVHNRSQVEMRLNSGPLPLRVGLKQLVDAHGEQVRGDTGYRVPGSPSIEPGGSIMLRVRLADLGLQKGLSPTPGQVTAVFTLVQESVAWLASAQGDGECRMLLQLPPAPAGDQ